MTPRNWPMDILNPPNSSHLEYAPALTGPVPFVTIPVLNGATITDEQQDALLLNTAHTINSAGINVDKPLSFQSYSITQNLVQSIITEAACHKHKPLSLGLHTYARKFVT